jgi:hypothetical protein
MIEKLNNFRENLNVIGMKQLQEDFLFMKEHLINLQVDADV